MHGGKRENAGRKKIQQERIKITRLINPKWLKKIDLYINYLRKEEKENEHGKI